MWRLADTHSVQVGVHKSLDDGSTGSRVFSCGVAVAGAHASWPLVRITVGTAGAMIAPRWRWLGVLFPPVYEFNWSDLRRVDVLTTLGRPRGLRFVLETPARVTRPYGAFFAVWRGPVRRLRVGLYPDALEAVRASIPQEIPQKRTHWLGP